MGVVCFGVGEKVKRLLFCYYCQIGKVRLVGGWKRKGKGEGENKIKKKKKKKKKKNCVGREEYAAF